MSTGLGRLGDEVRLLEAHLDRAPGHPVLHAALAGACADLGRSREARRAAKAAVAALGPPGSGPELQAIAHLARACRILGEAKLAAELHARLLPWRDRHIVAPLAAAYLGPAEAFLAVLAHTAGSGRAAAAHVEAAIDACDAAGCPQVRAHTQYEHALALLRRGGRFDAQEARRQLREAEATARRHDLSGLLAWIARLRREHGIAPD